MIRRQALALLLALLTLAAVPACSGGGPELPDGGQLLSDAAETMRGVNTARFALDVQGTVNGIDLNGAQGQLTRQGAATGTVTLDQAGQLAELRFVLTGDTLYLQGPTGGFRELPASLASSVYDPSTILDARRGVPALFGGATDAVTEAREEVDGVDTYRVRATFPAEVLGRLVPGTIRDTSGQVWIGAQQPYLVQGRFPLPDGTATVRLSEFDAPVDIAPPS
ncbi:MAG: LppX_LprAFG lipoprotein [Pseudonocardiaceae bacterium]|nr:LppX_LprAFG lipoprotein [Pseudonocardiaceae bacterium]